MNWWSNATWHVCAKLRIQACKSFLSSVLVYFFVFNIIFFSIGRRKHWIIIFYEIGVGIYFSWHYRKWICPCHKNFSIHTNMFKRGEAWVYVVKLYARLLSLPMFNSLEWWLDILFHLPSINFHYDHFLFAFEYIWIKYMRIHYKMSSNKWWLRMWM